MAIGSPLIRLKVEGEDNVAPGSQDEKAAAPPARTDEIEAQADGAVKVPEAIVERQAKSAPPQPIEKPQAPPVRMHRAPVTRAEGEKPIASPAVRLRAREAGVDLRQVPGSGPAGRITHEDLDAFFTPRETLEIQAGLYGVPRRERRSDEILAAVGLADRADAYARTLSGGMRRRLLVAKALVKVKEPLPTEFSLLRPGQILFTYLHLAASRLLTEALIKSGSTALAYETVEVNRRLPLLEPMSEIAGRMSIQVGAHYLEKEPGVRGVLLGGVPGVAPAKVAILGGGVAGVNAAQMAVGMRADVTI